MPKQSTLTQTSGATLANYVNISSHFLRSVRLDADLNAEQKTSGVGSYILQKTAVAVLENMAKQINETKQRAFTWTGPYGGGKSSLALMVCSLVGGNKQARSNAAKILGIKANSAVDKAFFSENGSWVVLPVVGRRHSVVETIDDCLDGISNAPKTPHATPNGRSVIDRLVALANTSSSGVLLMIDELGKFLESAAQAGDDVHFYQDLSEAASRCDGKLIVVGILHQAFDQYALRLGRDARDEWAKVQGRYVDIPLISGTDEVIELISSAISFKKEFDHSASKKYVNSIVESIKKRRPSVPADLADGLYRCWPLHPVTASLLGPISRRRFGQNERSIFGFLASREPIGFSDFLENQIADPHSLYGPARFWNYLKANLEPSILSSPDGHRWAVGAEAVERAEARGQAIHVDLVKTVSLIELFKSNSGVAPDLEVLTHSVEGATVKEIQNALSDLESWSILIFRKHLDCWGVYAGSDFDVDAAVIKARAEIDPTSLHRISELSNLFPVIAKRLYQATGSMRWFSKAIVFSSEIRTYIQSALPQSGSCGEFVLVLPSAGISYNAEQLATLASSVDSEALILGVPNNADRLLELGVELTALELVRKSREELEGDSVARREIDGRINSTRSQLEEQLVDAFSLATWHHPHIAKENSQNSLSNIASIVAERIYSLTPHIASELINRGNISSNAKSALRDLLHRMISHGDKENLDYEGYPADAGLFYTVIQPAGIHRKVNGIWRFTGPDASTRGHSFKSLWNSTTEYLSVADKSTSLEELYEFWAAKPYGVRSGVMPILALCFFLANRQYFAIYTGGVYSPDLTDTNVDEWLQDPRRIAFRFIQISQKREAFLQKLSTELTGRLGQSVSPEPLDSARGLVALIYALPGWTRRTNTISPASKEMRQLLMKAHDPHKVLFDDLPVLFSKSNDLAKAIVNSILELTNAYSKMLDSVATHVLRAIDHSGDYVSLRARGESVKGMSGDTLMEAFITRISTYDGSAAAVEGLISLAVSKPTKDCVDRDIDAAMLRLGAWAVEFRRTEILSEIQGRPSSRRAFAVVFGTGDGNSVFDTFDVSEGDTPVIDKLANGFLTTLNHKNIKREIFLAALAQAGAEIVGQLKVKEL